MKNAFTATPLGPDEVRAVNTPDPQCAYASLLDGGPVHVGPDGSQMLTRMADLIAVNRRRDVLGPGAHGPMMGGQRPLIPLDLDGPEHQKFRRLLEPLFSAKQVALFEPELRRLAGELIDGFLARGEADLLGDFCVPLPSRFFLGLMGLPDRDLPMLMELKDALLGHLPPHLTPAERFAAARAAGARIYGYFNAVLDERIARGAPRADGAKLPDLIDQLLAAEVDGDRLTRDQVVDICYLLVIAGLDTVVCSLALSLARLAREPALRRRLVERPGLWPTAVEELLRFESPVPTGLRFPSVDLEIGGQKIPAGEPLFLCWASANLDPETFPDPLTIDLERKPNAHIAFGVGFHRCLGTHLGRVELRVALEELHRRIPDYELKEGFVLEITGKPRTVNALPVVWK